MTIADYDQDGHLDVLMTGNSYSTEVSTGNYDAMSGLLLTGNGKGGFKPLNAAFTGFNADADSKGMVQINLDGYSSEILVASNNDKLKRYQFDQMARTGIKVNQNDVYIFVNKKDGTFFKQELFHGSTYLSASSRMLQFSDPVVSVTVVDYRGTKRNVSLQKN
jgi:hypothetical protein